MVIKEGNIIYDGNNKEYEVTEFIGNGSFGNVYKIVSKDNKETYALKTLPSSYPSDSVYKAFLNECEMSLQVRHENVIKYFYVHDGATYSPLPLYIIMEYANEGTLNVFINEKKKMKELLSNDDLESFMMFLCQGMKAINSVLVHRDIKPDNILINNSVLKISDFGLSKIVTENTRTMTFKGIGHIMYMATEGWKSEKNTIGMDIYSMGIVFYELATLTHPYQISNFSNIDEWKDAHFFQTAKRPEVIKNDLKPQYSQIITKMMDKNMATRYKNWDDIINDLNKDYQESNNSSNIHNILMKRLEKDSEIEKEKSERQKRYDEITNFQKLVYYQFTENIIKPIKEFIEEFNSNYLNGKIAITSSTSPSDRLTANIRLISGKTIRIELRTLIDENFYRKVTFNDFGEFYERTELRRPKIGNDLILAWGFVMADNGIGFNLILRENRNEVYGNWTILKNRSRALSRFQRLPAPFPFSFDEIEKEIVHVGHGMHIYVPEAHPFEPKFVIELIEEFN